MLYAFPDCRARSILTDIARQPHVDQFFDSDGIIKFDSLDTCDGYFTFEVEYV